LRCTPTQSTDWRLSVRDALPDMTFVTMQFSDDLAALRCAQCVGMTQ